MEGFGWGARANDEMGLPCSYLILGFSSGGAVSSKPTFTAPMYQVGGVQ